MSKKSSVYFGPPLMELTANLRDGDSVSGRINAVVERYLEIVRRDAIPLTDGERYVLTSVLMGSVIEPLLIRHLVDEIEDSEMADTDHARSLVGKLRGAPFASLVATIERVGR